MEGESGQVCLPLTAHPPWPRSPKSTMWPPAAPCQAWRWSGDSGALRGRPRLVAVQSGMHGSSLLGRRHYRCPKYSHPARSSDPDTLHAASSSSPTSPPLPLVCPANSHLSSGFKSNTTSGGLSRLQGPRRWPHPDTNGRDEECGGPREWQGSASWHHPCSGLVGPGHAHVKKQGLAEGT